MQNQLKDLKKIKFNKHNVKSLPDQTGIYIFFNIKKTPIYIGKANNVKSRVRSYLYTNLIRKTKEMVGEATHLSYILVGSELEALLLEAHLIRKTKPLYNSALKDDKKPLYIRISNEKYPRILTARKTEITKDNIVFLGPFPSTSNVRSVLKLLRKIFPYSQHKLGKRGCIYSQMGLCNPCPNEIEKISNITEQKKYIYEYKQNVRYIKEILSGRFTFVKKSLDKLMRQYAKDENYEMARVVRDQIEKLDYLTQPVTPIQAFLKNPNLLEDIREEEITDLKIFLDNYIYIPKKLNRIECYDVAHLAGTNPTASMVTFINGEPDKNYYRHFKIRQIKGQSDTDSMKEVGSRRSKHFSSWGKPNLIIVDGGKGQVSVFNKIFEKYKIPVVGLAKREEKLVIPVKLTDLSTRSFIERSVPNGPSKNLILRLRNEAHRFARVYHHKLLQKELIPQSTN